MTNNIFDYLENLMRRQPVMRNRKTVFGMAILVLSISASANAQQAISISDLVGHWGFGNSLMLTYLDHGTGDYSHSGNIYGMKYSIRPDGTFYYKFAARVGKETIRKSGLGTVLLSPGFITFKFDEGPFEKYRIVSLPTNSQGERVLSVVQAADKTRPLKCGHNQGYFDCTGSQEWKLRPAQ